MDMSPDYMAATVAHLEARGWRAERAHERRERDGTLRFTADRYRLYRGDDEVLELEALTYPDGVHTYHLAVERYHGCTSTSFPLDSWKHRPDRVEFKYYTHPETGLGLSLVIGLDPVTPASRS